MGKLHRVVLTGGPCAGKTTALVKLSDYFEARRWKVLRVPEAATVLFGTTGLGAVVGPLLSDAAYFKFQTNLLKTIVQLEESVCDVAASVAEEQGADVLVVHDRGALDVSVYMRPGDEYDWRRLLDDLHMTEEELMSRYDQVVHMVTAADGAESFYTLANNSARTETAEEARELDRKTREAWCGHPDFTVVPNETGKSFDDKMAKVIQVVCRGTGVEHTQMAGKFVIALVDSAQQPDDDDFSFINCAFRPTINPGSAINRPAADGIVSAIIDSARRLPALPDILYSAVDCANLPSDCLVFSFCKDYLSYTDDELVYVERRRQGVEGAWVDGAYSYTEGITRDGVQTMRPLTEREYLALRGDPTRAPLVFTRRYYDVDGERTELTEFFPPPMAAPAAADDNAVLTFYV